MIEIKIPKEINRYEAKFIGPFTLRQSVCLLIALPTCVVLYNALIAVAPSDVAMFICLIPAGIAFLFGWFKPYGMKLEVFLRTVFISAFVAPTKRKYCTENFYSKIVEQIRKEEEEANSKTKAGRSGKKYRRSKDAIR